MEEGLTIEELFFLRKMEDDLQRMSKEELIALAMGAQAKIFELVHHFEEIMMENGIVGQVQALGAYPAIPSSEEEMVQVFSGTPSDQEVAQLVQDRVEAFERFYGMDIDIEDIAMEEDV